MFSFLLNDGRCAKSNIERCVYILKTNQPNGLRRGLPKRARAVSNIFLIFFPWVSRALRRCGVGSVRFVSWGRGFAFGWFYFPGLSSKLALPARERDQQPFRPRWACGAGHLAGLDAAGGGRRGAPRRGVPASRASFKSLAPGSGLPGWFPAVDGNQVTEVPKLPDSQTC